MPTPRSCSSPTAPDHDLRVRFFTPRTEASFVGHATVATHFVLSREGAPPTAAAAGGRVRQRQKSGLVDIEVRGEGATRRIAVRQPAPPLGRQLNDRERLAVLDALALSTGDIDTRCPLRIVGGAGTRLMIGVRSTEQLKQLKPDYSRLTTLSAQLGAAGFFVFTLSHGLRRLPHRIAHVLPGARHPRGSGQRQRARIVRRLSRRAGPAAAHGRHRAIHRRAGPSRASRRPRRRRTGIQRRASSTACGSSARPVEIFETEMYLRTADLSAARTCFGSTPSPDRAGCQPLRTADDAVGNHRLIPALRSGGSSPTRRITSRSDGTIHSRCLPAALEPRDIVRGERCRRRA